MSIPSRPPYRRVVATEAAELEAVLYAAGHDPDAPEAERIWDIWLYRGLGAALAALEPKDEEPMATKVIRGLQVVEHRPQTAQQRLAALQQQIATLESENVTLKAQRELAAHQAAELQRQLENMTPAATLLERNAVTIRAAEPSLSPEAAYVKALEQRPDLYRRYNEENRDECE